VISTQLTGPQRRHQCRYHAVLGRVLN
jgi:hypothetical protein